MGEVKNSILKEVRKTLGELPPEQREAIDIAFNRNHRKIKDICTEKAIPYSTIRSRVTAGIDHIRRQLTVKGIYRTLGEVRRIGGSTESGRTTGSKRSTGAKRSTRSTGSSGSTVDSTTVGGSAEV